MLPIVVFLLLVLSCSAPTFYQKTYQFNKNLATGNFEAAEKIIEENKNLENSKIRFLYFVNAGTVEHLKGDFKKSNEYFEKADLFIEDERKKALQEGAAFLLNPNISTYFGEDHEVLLVHYYKALNYYLLGEPEEALVEVRRLNLKLLSLSEKYKSEKRYTQDAFMHALMGMIYEANNDTNNAFIAYRNAYNIYESDYAAFFGMSSPTQLQRDLIRTAALSGMNAEKQQYEMLFNMSYEKEDTDASMLLLWNNGMGPVKAEWGLNFAIVYTGGGWISFVNKEFGFTFPFYIGDTDLGGLTWIKVVFPKYVNRPSLFNAATATANGKTYSLELAEDVNAVSFKILDERMLYEFGSSLVRVALKQVAAHKIGEGNDSPALGTALSVLASATESADTRNWQTIPHSIFYTRIPLPSGKNTVEFEMRGGVTEKHLLEIELEPGETAIYPFYSLGAEDPLEIQP